MEKVKDACLRGVRDVQTPPAPFLGGEAGEQLP